MNAAVLIQPQPPSKIEPMTAAVAQVIVANARNLHSNGAHMNATYVQSRSGFLFVFTSSKWRAHEAKP